MNQLPSDTLQQSITYDQYRKMIDALLAQQKTTGDNHSDAMLHYTQLNVARMNRLDKKTVLLPETIELVQQIKRPQIWLVLTEAWCGDAAQIIPVIQKMAEINPHIQHQLILRDEHPAIMDAFLTNGARSIPKVIILDAATYEVIGSWGPRPTHPQQLVLEAKAAAIASPDEATKKMVLDHSKIAIQKWYAKDKTRSIQQEFGERLRGLEV